MILNRFDDIQISGLHPYNPGTGERIEASLQSFMLTRDVEGDTIPTDALYPIIGGGYPSVEEPIAMTRIVRKNYIRIQ